MAPVSGSVLPLDRPSKSEGGTERPLRDPFRWNWPPVSLGPLFAYRDTHGEDEREESHIRRQLDHEPERKRNTERYQYATALAATDGLDDGIHCSPGSAIHTI